MMHFNWNSLNESTFQGFLNKYTNAFKRYQTRYFVLDENAKALLYFMPDDVRKKGFRGAIELTSCCVLPSDEDDVTFSIQTNGPESFKLRARDAKERQKWIDKIRACSGTNAANAYASSLSIPKVSHNTQVSATSPPKDHHPIPRSQRVVKSNQRQHTLRELNEVIRCVGINQRDFVETIETIPEDIRLNSLSKEMLLLCSLSRSCISSLEDSVIILSNGRPWKEPHPVAASTLQKQFSRSMSNGTHEKTSPSLSSSPTSTSQPKAPQ